MMTVKCTQGNLLYFLLFSEVQTEEAKKDTTKKKAKRPLKRANTEAIPGFYNPILAKSSSSSTEFLSKEEARKRMLSWKKTTSFRND